MSDVPGPDDDEDDATDWPEPLPEPSEPSDAHPPTGPPDDS